MKRKLVLLLGLLMISQPVFANFKEHFDLGTQYLSNYRYSSAIDEFKSALRINYKDNSARIQIINAYLARGMHYANTEKNWEKAADDYRSALFYLELYPEKDKVQVASILDSVKKNLETCLNMQQYDRSPESRFAKAKALRADGELAASAYEFNQSLGEASQVKDCYSYTGDIMKILGNEPKAAEYYRKAISVDPTDIPLRLSYATLLDKLGSEEAAVEEYNYILTKSIDNKNVLNSLERIFKKKVENSPSDPDLNANMGAILQKQNKYDEALEYYKKAEQLSPSNINTRINIGTLYQQKGDYKTAIIAYDSVLILEPNNVNANMYKAQCKAALGESKAAQELYKKVVSLDPGNTVAQTALFESAKNSMSVSDFIEYLGKNANGADTTEMLYSYALELHKANKYDDAITLYKYLLPKDTTGETYLNLAIAQTQQEKYKDALAVLNSAKEQFPNNELISKTIDSINETLLNNQLDKAANLYKSKDYANSIVEYLKIDPPTYDTMLAVASAYQNMDDNTNAIAYYKKALELKPTDSEVAYYIAALYSDMEDFDSAEAYAQKSLLLNKNNKDSEALLAEIHKQNRGKMLNEAISLYDLQNYEQSLPLLNDVLAEEPDNAYALYYRAMIYDNDKKYYDAIKDYKKAIELNPDELKIINYMLAVDYDNLEKYKDAYDYYVKYSSSDVPEDEFKTYAADRAKELKEYAEQSTKPVANKS